MTYKLNDVSISRLNAIKPELKLLATAAIAKSPYQFVISDGLRTAERQKQLVAAGKSKTLKSKHLTGDAFDIAIIIDNRVTWDKKYYTELSDIFKSVAEEQGIKIKCGVDFKGFFDGPHYELA